MNLVSVDEAATVVGKTSSMIYFLTSRNVIAKHPQEGSEYAAPKYLVDADEVVSYYKNKKPRTDYSNFLSTACVTVDGEEYVTIQTASEILNQTHSRLWNIANKYEVRITTVTKPRKGSIPHKLYCLRDLSEINETVSKIVELREFLASTRKKQ